MAAQYEAKMTQLIASHSRTTAEPAGARTLTYKNNSLDAAKRFSKPTERKPLRAIAHICGLLGAHGGWWSWRRRHHQLVS
jgi:hypothetical protein